MNYNPGLDKLLFDKKKDKDFKTESLFNSVDVSQVKNDNSIEFYILPNTSNTLNPNVLNYDKITDISIKNKMLKINSSMRSFNIILKSDTSKNEYSQLNPTMIDNFLSSDNNKNYFINYLLELVIDLIWKIKEDNLLKDLINEKINNLNILKEELEKKNRKLNSQLEESKREIKKIFNKNIMDEIQGDSNKKIYNNEVNELKLENKKLNSLNVILKNENKKREVELNRIQDKLKKMFSSGYNNNSIIYKNQNFEISILENSESNFYKNILTQNLIYNQQNYENLIKQNSCLLNILHDINGFFEKICSRSKAFYEKIDNNSNKFTKDLIQIKDNIFSLHLIDDNLLNDFKQKFLANLINLEEILNHIIEYSIKNIVCNQTNTNESKSIKNAQLDNIKNFKRWSLNIDSKTNLLKQNKWFENIDRPKQINYEYDESTVIKCFSPLNLINN